MPTKRWKRAIFAAIIILFCLAGVLMVFVDRFIEPILKDRLHTLIVQGSDSLYTYSLGRLHANFFGGNVEVENLQIRVDSTRYEFLRQRNGLPSLTMQLSLGKGSIKGVGIFALLFGRKIRVEEILSKDAVIRLSRHIKKFSIPQERPPIWAAIRPKIESISIGRIRLDGIKMLYKNIDTSESIKIRFERCDALFKDIQIDSASAFDTTRIGFTRSISMKFSDVKFRTEDSTYKMKAKAIAYSSNDKELEVDSFKLQPTLDKEEISKTAKEQKELYYITFNKVKFVNVRLDHFIYYNVIDGDSIVFEKPDAQLYLDKSLSPDFASKIGRYPHQQLLKASSTIILKNLLVHQGSVSYTEKDAKTHREGTFSISNLNIHANNITNDSNTIKRSPIMTATASCTLLGSSPVTANFRFYLDSSDGQYQATGTVRNVTAAQLNPLAIPLGNVQINSFNLQSLSFDIRGQDFFALANVHMRYSNLSLTLRKTDKETGETKTKKFLTKLLNRFALWPDNPGPAGQERIASNVRQSRLTTEAFFGLLWKSMFKGMENIMLKSGTLD